MRPHAHISTKEQILVTQYNDFLYDKDYRDQIRMEQELILDIYQQPVTSSEMVLMVFIIVVPNRLPNLGANVPLLVYIWFLISMTTFRPCQALSAVTLTTSQRS